MGHIPKGLRAWWNRLFLPKYWQSEREWLLLKALYAERDSFAKKSSRMEQQMTDLKNEVATFQAFCGSMQDEMERDLPPVFEQVPWECGYYSLPSTDKEWYFNPTILQQQGQKWLFARRIWHERYVWLNEIVPFRLDANNAPVERKRFYLPQGTMAESFEDPRAIYDGKQWWISAVDFIQNQTFAHQIMVQLDSSLNPFKVYHPVAGRNGAALRANTGHEKNWMWFWHDGQPHVIYYTVPHTIYRFDWYYGITERYQSDVSGALWMHGEPRGGTPPIRVGNEYWSFFHSFTPWKHPKRRYHMGAYAFEAKPPFKVTRMTSLPLLSASARDPIHEMLPIVVFPGGALFENGMWHVVLGINDLKCAWMRIPHADLESLTRPLDGSRPGFPIPNQKDIERQPVTLPA